MKRDLTSNMEFVDAIKNNELVYIFGTGISSALTGKRYSWWQWICDGIDGLKDLGKAKELKTNLYNNNSTENMVQVVGDVLNQAKLDGTYHYWMKTSFESNEVENKKLVKTLQKLLITQDVFATTNYDLLLEQATGLNTVTYEQPEVIFPMLDSKISKYILHLHGAYDSENNIDNIIANQEQYAKIYDNEGAQFIQNLLGTRTLIFIGCGKTTEDPNISRFIQFASNHLKLVKPYYSLCKEGEVLSGMPSNIINIPYGDNYDDLPIFMEEIAQIRLLNKTEDNGMVGRTIYSENRLDAYGLAEYHYSKEYLKFCGRKRELAQLQDFLDKDLKISWWAITGQAGAGKSRLAYELMFKTQKHYFSFFLNLNVLDTEIEKFKPFNDTLVIVDYVKGNENRIAEITNSLFILFRESHYKLRILYLERDNIVTIGSWYKKLEDKFKNFDRVEFLNCEYNFDYTSRAHRFLFLEDMDEGAVVEMIGYICKKKQLPIDSYRDQRLKEEYASKFEQLRFRPLFVRMFVESWIDNGCIQVTYHNYEDLLKSVLKKEEERWIEAVDGNMKCCSSLVRLLIRASISEKIELEYLPEDYIGDWNSIKQFNRDRTLPGYQREESLLKLTGDAEHALLPEKGVLRPIYPDIFKEAMFLYYTDEDEFDLVCDELWINDGNQFVAFLSRCLLDFPDNEKLYYCVNRASEKYNNVSAMEARLALLQKHVVFKDDDPSNLLKVIERETKFWKDMPYRLELSDSEKEIKMKGLYYSGIQYSEWSLYDKAMSCFEEIALLALDTKTIEIACNLLGERIKNYSDIGYWKGSERLIEIITPLTEKLLNKSRKRELWLIIKCNEIKNLLLKSDREKADKVYNSIEEFVDWGLEREVEMYAYACFLLAKGEYEKLASSDLLNYTDDLQNLAVNFDSIAFNDKSHYYYLHAKYYAVDVTSMGGMIIGQESKFLREFSLHLVEGLIHEIEANEMINDFSGLLVGGKVLKIKISETISDDEVIGYIHEAEKLIDRYPDNEFLVEKYIEMQNIATINQFESLVSKETIEKTYALMLRFPNSKTIIDEFFQLLESSVERNNWSKYIKNKAIVTGIIRNKRFELLSPPSQQIFIRVNKKIGANEKCPCGSGKKFKKCCRDKGIYD